MAQRNITKTESQLYLREEKQDDVQVDFQRKNCQYPEFKKLFLAGK